ncbi:MULTISPECIES: nitrite reductase small subunit NirD [Microbacterium]|uniref:Assimilatory nitrite reductase (NAD(P)H) small subunit n=1 Tax=Microbacterium saccharophilum TaxID=1213358 RepID=A0A7Z7CW37_9MICO|nr:MULTISPECIES: nitrite reductase small subunit NirD [Microbacterium]SFI21995.1 assimilatory nitrite reductase (NAD(P)H) small subunit [Microbacterium saccharophilum]
MSLLVATPTWVWICAIGDLEAERGRAALYGEVQVALFLLRDGTVHAVSNRDPYSGAQVISRGIVGTKGDAPTVASPMYKQVFDLRTGVCLETHGKDPRALTVWPVGRRGDDLYLRWEE